MRFPRGSIFLFLLVCCTFAFAQFTIPEKPKEQTSVYDYINLLSPSQKTDLEQKLIRYSDSTSTQIVITIIKSTQGENINYLGAQWGQKWGIGQKGKDNGVLVILAKDDRRVAINTGYGVEGSLADAIYRRIIETVIIPEFKKGDYYAGLYQGCDTIFKVLTGEFKEDRTLGNNHVGFPFRAMFPVLIFIVILIILANRNKRNGGNSGGRRTSGPSIWDMIIL